MYKNINKSDKILRKPSKLLLKLVDTHIKKPLFGTIIGLL
jgi:hypothetical protein